MASCRRAVSSRNHWLIEFQVGMEWATIFFNSLSVELERSNSVSTESWKNKQVPGLERPSKCSARKLLADRDSADLAFGSNSPQFG